MGPACTSTKTSSLKNSNIIYNPVIDKKSFRSFESKYYINLSNQNKIQENDPSSDQNLFSQKQKIEIFFTLMNLPKYSTESYKVIVLLDDKLLGETECREGSNINFSNTFKVDYYFEASQKLKTVLTPSNKFKKYEEEFNLQFIMRSKQRREDRELLINDANDKITLVVLCEPNFTKKEEYLQNYKFYDIRMINVPNSGNRKLYFEFHHFKDNYFWRPLYQSETLVNTINPQFKEFYLKTDLIRGNSSDTQIMFIILDHESGYVGEAKTSISGLLNSSFTSIIDPFFKEIGKIEVKFTEYKDILYKDLIESLKFFSIVAIDFTLSNGIQSHPKSLHFCGQKEGEKQNAYQETLTNLERLIIYFNSTEMIPFYGFGGISPGGNTVDFCCDLNNFYPKKEEIIGVGGLLAVYGEIIKLVNLSGPTLISPILEMILQTHILSLNNNPFNYFVLWVLVDGDIDDIAKAEKVLEEAYMYGLSIVICGLGDEKFLHMNDFICCANKLKRSFVHFYKMKEYQDKLEVLYEKLRNSLSYDVKNYYILRKLTPRRVTQFY